MPSTISIIFPLKRALSFQEEGKFSLRYYAVDEVGNTEEDNIQTFTVDLSPPSTFHNVNGNADEYVIAMSSTLYLTVEDNLSGVEKTFYRFDKETFKEHKGQNLDYSYLEDGEHVPGILFG